MAAIELNNTPLKNDANLQGYWRMEDNWNDSSPNGYTLTPSGSPTFATAQFGKGGSFAAASNQYASITNAAGGNLNITGSQTWIAWVKPTTLANNKRFISKLNTDFSHYRLLYQVADGTLYFLITGLSTNPGLSAILQTGSWQMIAGRYDASLNKLAVFHKIGSTESKNEVDVTGSPGAVTGPFVLSSDSTTGHQNGMMDDVAIFDRALTDAELSAYYNGTLATGNFFQFM